MGNEKSAESAETEGNEGNEGNEEKTPILGMGFTMEDVRWRAEHPGIDPETGRLWSEVSEREQQRNVSLSDLEASGLEVARLAMGLAWQAYLACKYPDEWPGGTYFYGGMSSKPITSS
jgi:hypothetical protein